MDEHPILEAGLKAAQSGDRETAYLLFRQAVIAEPRHAPAWYYMSFLVDDLDQQRQYLEWALSLEPGFAEARDALEQVRVRQAIASARTIVAPEFLPPPRKIGDYLIEQGLITPAQCDAALAELQQAQLKSRRGVVDDAKAKRFGDILLQRGWLTPDQLADALVRQQQERLRGGHRPERLGDYLLAQRHVTGAQLGSALAQQSGLRMRGKHVRLGELLVRGGQLAAPTLSAVLDQQHQDFASRYGNL